MGEMHNSGGLNRGELRGLQRAFTEHLRDPERVPVPAGLDERRMGIYSELVFNNLSGLLADFFPVIKSVIPAAQWNGLIRDFFVSHESQTPYFPKIAGEFVEYLSRRQLGADLPPFMVELAHYEWLELALYTLDEEPPAAMIDPARLGTVPLALSPLALPLACDYPVHRIRPGFQPSEPGESQTFLLMLRDPGEKVRFFELQPLAYEMLHQIDETPGFIAERWLGQVAADTDPPVKSEFVRNGIALLQSFNEHLALVEC